MDLTKTRKGREDTSIERNQTQAKKRISFNKYLELAFWGTVFWGIFRLIIHFFHFTPYGLAYFAHPFMGADTEKTFAGAALGALVLFVGSLVASFVYLLIFSRMRAWWTGLLYGAILLLIAGFFNEIVAWKNSTLSTEIAWFLSYGLFIGMTLTLEQSDITDDN